MTCGLVYSEDRDVGEGGGEVDGDEDGTDRDVDWDCGLSAEDRHLRGIWRLEEELLDFDLTSSSDWSVTHACRSSGLARRLTS